MSTAHGITTAQQLQSMAADGSRYELVRGELRRMSPAGFAHGRLTMNISTPLDVYVRAHKLGVVCAAETGFLLSTNPDTVRAADVAFIRQHRVEANQATEKFWPGAPDLAVEVISPHDLYTEVEAKVTDWLEAGTQVVMIVNPRNRTVRVYRSLSEIVVLQEPDTIEGAEVVPGWELPVASLFA